MKIYLIFFAAFLSSCAGNPPTTPLIPPFDYMPSSEGTSLITFIDTSNNYHGHYNVIVYEKPDKCVGQHSLNRRVTDSITVPNNKELSFAVLYTIVGYESSTLCTPIFTMTPKGGNYEVITKMDEKYCSTNVVTRDQNNNIKNFDYVEKRVWKRPIFESGGWCEKR
jgi:hypothetical protein